MVFCSKPFHFHTEVETEVVSAIDAEVHTQVNAEVNAEVNGGFETVHGNGMAHHQIFPNDFQVNFLDINFSYFRSFLN